MAHGDSPADEKPAGGLEAVTSAFSPCRARDGRRAAASQALGALNQPNGFDCPGCAWPEPDHRRHFEFCENGAKALAHEATRRSIGAEFFARVAVAALRDQSDHWLEAAGPADRAAVAAAGRGALPADRVGRRLRAHRRRARTRWARPTRRSSTPRAAPATRPRSSTSCSRASSAPTTCPTARTCATSRAASGSATSIGVGKGTVGLDDFELADAIFVIGQNPGTNHPRMLTTLQAAKRRGCRIVSVNPLRERGLVRFAHPQEPLGAARARGHADRGSLPARCGSAATSRCSRAW